MPNGDNQPIEEPKKPKDCPMTGLTRSCTESKCEWWVEINMMKPGMPVPEKVGMCVFKANLIVAAMPTPQPQIMKMPMPPGMMPPGFNPLKQ